MATSFISPFSRAEQNYNERMFSSTARNDAVDAERYALRAQDIIDTERSMRENTMQRHPVINPYSYMTATADSAVNHPIAEIHKRLAQLEQYGQAELKRISDAGLSLNTRVDHLLHQLENQNTAILELSRIIDELKQDGLQPPEPLEDID